MKGKDGCLDVRCWRSIRGARLEDSAGQVNPVSRTVGQCCGVRDGTAGLSSGLGFRLAGEGLGRPRGE